MLAQTSGTASRGRHADTVSFNNALNFTADCSWPGMMIRDRGELGRPPTCWRLDSWADAGAARSNAGRRRGPGAPAAGHVTRSGDLSIEHQGRSRYHPGVVSRTHNFIFVHIPKTGGNALQHALLNLADDTLKIGRRNFHDGVERFGLALAGTTLKKHSTIGDYADQLEPEFFEHARKFTIVRNPWDRAISSYFFRPKELPPLVEGRPMVECAFDPDAFLESAARLKPVSHHICASGQAIENHPIHRFLRTETLQADMDAWCVELGLSPVAIVRRNVGHHRHYTEYYDRRLRGAVARMFAEEIEYFGYTFT
jgi:hypothetical protein